MRISDWSSDVCSSDLGIILPESVAPYQVALINLRADDATCAAAADDIYAKLTAAGKDTLYDDRYERSGAKFATADLLGLPWQLVIGPKGLASGVVELKNRRHGAKVDLSTESARSRLIGLSLQPFSPRRRDSIHASVLSYEGTRFGKEDGSPFVS